MTTAKAFLVIPLICFIQFVAIYGGSDELLQSWKKINSNYGTDIQQSNEIYNKIKTEQGALQQLRTIVEKHLRIKNAELLANTISSHNITRPANNLKDLVKMFNKNYSREMVEGIFAEAIKEITFTTNLTQLPDVLWNIYQENDKELFEIMLRAQMKLYTSVSKQQHPDEKEFTRILAHKLYKIKKDSLFNYVDLGLKLKVQNIVQQLPTSLKYLYFRPYFCLANSEYSTYIYAAVDAKVGARSRYIWLWYDSKSMDDTGHIEAELGDLNGNKISATLKSRKYQIYYYMMPDKLKVAGWDSTDAPSDHIWNIEFLDNDRVAFAQNDYLMCAVENYDKERRNVAGRKREKADSTSPECQWRIDQCTF